MRLCVVFLERKDQLF